jgi:hypothetical protein
MDSDVCPSEEELLHVHGRRRELSVYGTMQHCGSRTSSPKSWNACLRYRRVLTRHPDIPLFLSFMLVRFP